MVGPAAGRAEGNERSAFEEQLLERVRLEELVASVAASLIGVDLADVEGAIERGLGRVATALGADGAYFLRDAKRTRDVVFVEWSATRPGRRAADRTPLPEPARLWWAEQMGGGKPVHVHDVRDLGPEAAEAGVVLAAQAVRSILLVPLHRHHRFTGFVGLFTAIEPKTFSEDVASLLQVAGECFMAALGQADSAAALLDARRELEHRNADLERSNEDLERFAYAAAHDLKAPLSRIEMALASDLGTSPNAQELLGIARRGATRMRQLIEDLLAYAAIGVGTGARGPVDLDDVLDEVLADLSGDIEARGIRVDRGPLPEVVGHRAPLGQLLQNLVSNSIKFARRDVVPVIRIDAVPAEGGNTIRIADNGIGIEPSQRADVFGVLIRVHTDDRYPGSGIGLATCAKVVAHHGGRIWVEDGVDGGAALHVWLPAPR